METISRSYFLAACLAVAAAAGVAACKQGPTLPGDPGLGSDPFGIGIAIGSGGAEIEAAKGRLGGAELWVLTREEFITKDPYAEHKEAGDLLVALTQTAAESEDYQVVELRAYLGGAKSPALRLLGQPLGSMGLADAGKLLGQPIHARSEPDGVSHLEWQFAKPKSKGSLYLTMSFDAGNLCRALALESR